MESLDIYLLGCLLCVIIAQGECQLTAQNCSAASDCGTSAVCQDDTCTCEEPLVMQGNGRDCRCRLLHVASQECVLVCEGVTEEQDGAFVCRDQDDEDMVSLLLAIGAGAGVGALMCLVVIVAFCCYLSKTRRNVTLHNKHYTSGQMEVGHMKQIALYDNNAFESDNQHDIAQLDATAQPIDPIEYANELVKLQPHSETLMTLLSQTKAKTKAMDPADPRLPTYKGVIHQLCRVMVLLHRKEVVTSATSVPSDALGLLQWAHQMVDDHREQQSSSGGTELPPIAQISSVDLDPDLPPVASSPVYATPDGSQGQGSPLAHILASASPYSSVAVPVSQSNTGPIYQAGTGTIGRSRRPLSGFATISRTPSVPNGALIRSLEADDNIQNIFAGKSDTQSVNIFNMFSGGKSDTQSVTTPRSNNATFLRQQDLSSFLISSPERNENCDSVERLSDKENAEPVHSVHKSDTSYNQRNAISNIEFDPVSPTQFNTVPRPSSSAPAVPPKPSSFSYQRPPNPATNNNSNNNTTDSFSSVPPRPISFSYQRPSNPLSDNNESNVDEIPLQVNNVNNNNNINSPRDIDNFKGVKKNIITNPKALKKSSSMSKPLKSVSSAPNIGIMATSRYYNPNPMINPNPMPTTDSEVYAPGSFSSDRSNAMSTFLGDMSVSRPPSSLGSYGQGDSDDTDGEVFPFDPSEATDPVEV